MLNSLFGKLIWLMFGTEGERSPSAYANSMMVLKLIAVGRMTWTEAFDGRKFGGGLFNMSMEGAVNIARTAESVLGHGKGQNYYQGPVSKPSNVSGELAEFFERQELVGNQYVEYKISRNSKKYLTPNPTDVVRMGMERLYKYQK